jgi:hypothetical protein
MHQHSVPGLQAKFVPQREHCMSMTALSHVRQGAPEGDASTRAIVVPRLYRYDDGDGFPPIKGNKSNRGELCQ